jgi:hypothetical protein
MPTLDAEIIVALIALVGVLAPVIVKLGFMLSRGSRTSEELLRITREKAVQDSLADGYRHQREDAHDKRQAAYDVYDERSKELMMAMARSMISGNDAKKLQEKVNSVEKAAEDYRVARRAYHATVSLIANRRIGRG